MPLPAMIFSYVGRSARTMSVTIRTRSNSVRQRPKISHHHRTTGLSTFSSWSFPSPPPPPSYEEVSMHGLPFLRQVVQHADRPFLSEWPMSATASNNDQSDDDSVSVGRVEDHRILTYEEVISKAIQVAQHIRQHVIHGSSSPSSPFIAHSTIPGSDYIACQWGVYAVGKASVPLSISQKTPELEHVLQDSNPSVILVSAKAPNHDQVLQAVHNVQMTDRIIHVEELISSVDANYNLLDAKGLLEHSIISSPSLDQPALLLYTSGTTGKPKGVVHTHRSLYHQITDLVAAWEWQPEDVAIHVLPLHHVHGVVNILSCAAYAGAQLQFQPFDAYKLWKQWAHQPPLHAPYLGQHNTKSSADYDPYLPHLPRPTVFMAVPTIYAKLLEAAKSSPPGLIRQAVERTLYPMRLQVSGSAALPTKVLHEWKQVTQYTLLERYGMTEFAMALSNPYNEIVAPRQAGYVGVPLPSVQVRLVCETTGSVLLDQSHQNITTTTTTIVQDEPPISGSLQVKGPTVFAQYWNRPEATQQAFTDDGYFDTGDVAEYNPILDSYRILGRASVDILKVGGYKVSALEIERELLEHPDVAEVVIVGIPDDVWGQRVGMIARLGGNQEAESSLSSSLSSSSSSSSSSPTLEQVQSWCEPRMAQYKIPTRLLWQKEIPKNAMGKINKKELVPLLLS